MKLEKNFWWKYLWPMQNWQNLNEEDTNAQKPKKEHFTGSSKRSITKTVKSGVLFEEAKAQERVRYAHNQKLKL